MVFGRTVPDLSLNAIANLGYAAVKFYGPVFVGDTSDTIKNYWIQRKFEWQNRDCLC